ncbi:MAG: DMT family transporter [Polyangiaceae bacterium]
MSLPATVLTDDGPAKDRPIAPAPALLVLASLLFAAMAVLAKNVAHRLPGPEVAFVRFCLGLVACAIASTRVKLKARNKLGLLMRGAFGGGAVLLYFLAIEHLQVGVATLLNYTAPVFTALYAMSFLGELVTPAMFGALGLTTVGVGLVLKGTAPPGTMGFGLWQWVGIGSALLSGAAVATIREVRKTDGSWEIFTAFCIGGATMTALPTATGWISPTPTEWGALLVVGLLSVVAQLLLTYSLRFVTAAGAGIIIQLTPVAALTMGWILFEERMAGWAIAGAAITLVGVSWGAFLASTPHPAQLDEN